MPKPRSNWSSHSHNHNDGMEVSTRRVSFKQNRGNNHQRGGSDMRNWRAELRARFEEAGVELDNRIMNRQFNNRNDNKKNHRGNSPPPPKGSWLQENPMSWYRVNIPYGNKYEKAMLLQKLVENVRPLPLIPYVWQALGKNAITFYVEDFQTAQKLHTLHREIEMPDGFKMNIKVTSGTPFVDLNPELREKMKQVMAKSYNPAAKALDMSRFHAHPELQLTFLPLFKPAVSTAAITIISENIPELEALNWNDNKIHTLTHLRDINKKLPNLKILHLGNNKLKNINQLDSFVGIPLVELLLDGNTLCDNYKDQASYISEVRKRFPRLLKLDGVDLPPPISFDLEEVTIPASKQTFLCNQEGQVIVRQFLEQYITIMDSKNRQPLLHAYHENAMFSLTMSYPFGYHPKGGMFLNWYSTDNRNLERVTDVDRRRKLLKQGHLAVVAFLQAMPQTKHDMNGFTVDLTLYTPQMLIVTVTGQFKEVKSNKKMFIPIRHFLRTFVIVPSGSGFCIINEEVHVTNATEEQIKGAFKTPVVTTVTPTPVAPPPSQVTSPIAAAVVPAGIIDDITKQQMVQALSQESGMKIEWARKCLEETNWDFPRAQFAFSEAKSNGAIPADAFVN